MCALTKWTQCSVFGFRSVLQFVPTPRDTLNVRNIRVFWSMPFILSIFQPLLNPAPPPPQVFGMHENASITCAIAETEMSFSIVLSMQPRTGGGGGASREDLIGDIAKDMENR